MMGRRAREEAGERGEHRLALLWLVQTLLRAIGATAAPRAVRGRSRPLAAAPRRRATARRPPTSFLTDKQSASTAIITL
jgi:hypothetical protein